MRRSIDKVPTLIVLCVSLLAGDCPGYQKVKKPINKGSVTGTYKYVLNSLEVLEMPDHKVRISFTGVWPNDHKRVETRNMGSFDETVTLNGRTAVVKPEYGDDDCAITLEFRAGKAVVTQEGYSCGFGFNVEAEGTYTRVSSKPPDLPPRDPDRR